MRSMVIRVVGIVLCALLLVGLDLVGIQVYVSAREQVVSVPCAARDIKPRERISEGDIRFIEVPYAYVNTSAYVQEKDIIGLYTDIQGMIPEGSLFYKSMLLDESELPDYPMTQLKQGESAFSMQTDVVALSGNSIVAGQRVDLYVTIEKENVLVVMDKLVEHARVISIKDHNGLEIDDVNSNHIPYVITFALDPNSFYYMNLAAKKGSIDIVVPSVTYGELDSDLVEDSQVISYLLSENI
ncbi:MAG: hypothetical protein HUJ56_08260 [Erysipelotrichaceae bacterium]|nr:hypothetical protein [Erysipelotrichaceae bacterium]